ncbi:MAG TPA: tripartite tricarboxylate transporter substrate binding protein [Casimicrobiaceae bacterium]|jgi:tripartite-type tricarboxylate transporter receptor subunit TctC|nr:tripartite tricarboxylate transporter substrate binding protein [Casimicrobiaceae bacterium]
MNARLDRRQFLATLAALAVAPAWADTFPSRPVRLVVPFPPGGAVDFYARVVQAQLAERFGQPIVIENRPGASGMIGADNVAKSAPDGYSLLLGNIATLAINVGLYAKMPYNPVTDFTPITHTIDVNYVLVVHPSVPVHSVRELIDYAKANPDKLAFGSAGSGSLPHLAGELFKSLTGVRMIHVPYKGGGPMVTDLLAGSVQLVIADQANLMPHVKSGKLRALAVASAKRSPGAPELPTIAEAGVPGFQAVAWNGLVGPAGMSPDVVQRINRVFVDTMAVPDIRARLLDAGLDPIGDSPDSFGRFIPAEIAKWSKIAKDVGAHVD